MPPSRRDILSALGATFAAPMVQIDAATVPRAGTNGPAVPPGQPTVAQQLAQFTSKARFEDIPAVVIEKAKGQMAFFFGRAFEAAATLDAINLQRVLAPHHVASGCTVVGQNYVLNAPEAALANGSLMRGQTGSDDVIWPAGIHAGVITIPPALAIGERNHCSGREVLAAIVLGYEVLGKLGSVRDGWTAPLPRRPTNIFGGFGPVTVAARLLKLGTARTAAAMGYAANCTMGIPEGGMMPHYYGLINNIGLLSAEMAAAGAVPYASSTIEGDTGLYKSFFGEVPASLFDKLSQLGRDWEILTAEQKRYPGTGQNAVAVDLFLKLLKQERLKPSDVERIDVVQPGLQDSPVRKMEVASQGPFTRAVAAYSSLPFALALALLESEVNEGWYLDDVPLERLNAPAIAVEMKKVFLTYEDRPATPRYCRLTVRTRGGRELRREVADYSFPFPPEQWRPWIVDRGAGLLGRDSLNRLSDAIEGLERVPDVAKPMALARTARQPRRSPDPGRRR